MKEVHRTNIDFALRSLSFARAVLDGTGHALREAAVEFHDPGYERRIERAEEHAGRRLEGGAVNLVKGSVAEHAVAIQVMGDGQVERLIEIVQPFRTASGYRYGEDRKCQDEYQRYGRGWNAGIIGLARCGNASVLGQKAAQATLVPAKRASAGAVRARSGLSGSQRLSECRAMSDDPYWQPAVPVNAFRSRIGSVA